MKTKDLKDGFYMFGNKGAMWSNEAHIAKNGEPTTLCGTPMLSSNWCRIEKLDEVNCPECLKKYEELNK